MEIENTVWHIRDWDTRYEKAQSKIVKHLCWISFPCRMDSDEHTAIRDHENGLEHLGIWVCLLMAASSSRPRGLLLRQNGIPHDVASLSRVTRIPAPILEEVIPRLIEIGSIEVMDLDAVRTLINGSKHAAKPTAPLPKELVIVLKKLGVPEDCPIEIRDRVMKAAAEFGGPAKFAAGLEKAIEAGCTDLNSATAYVRKTGWSEADRKAKDVEQEPEIRCDND